MANHLVLNANVVVIARHHNPSILNPDFLKINKIVDKDWDVLDTLTTIPFSQTRFKNGVSIVVDNDKMNITQEVNNDYQDNSPIYDIAINYLRILEHVKYTAVGLNWNILAPMKNPGPWLIEHFLKKSSVPKSSPPLEELSLSMSFRLNGCLTNFHLAPIAPKESVPKNAVLIKTNTHYDIQKTSEIVEALTKWKETQQLVKAQIEKLIF